MNLYLKKCVIIFMILLFIFQNVAIATYVPDDTIYVWSDSTTQTAVQDGENSDFLDLTCESAILIEQTTRNCFVSKRSTRKITSCICYKNYDYSINYGSN